MRTGEDNPTTQPDEGAPAPVSVVFLDENGNTLAPADLHKVQGNIRWEIQMTGTLDPEAQRLHEAGRAAGERGDYDAALSLFTEAIERDPEWPYPVYDRAFTHLLQQNFDLALDDYRKTLELSPVGFFTAREAVDMLTREKAGEFPRGLHRAFAMLTDMPDEQQRSMLQQLVDKYPSHAPGWDAYANLVADPAARLAAIERGLAAHPDVDTRGSLLVQKALTLSAQGRRAEAREILQPLVDEPPASLATYPKAALALALIARQSATE